MSFALTESIPIPIPFFHHLFGWDIIVIFYFVSRLQFLIKVGLTLHSLCHDPTSPGGAILTQAPFDVIHAAEGGPAMGGGTGVATTCATWTACVPIGDSKIPDFSPCEVKRIVNESKLTWNYVSVRVIHMQKSTEQKTKHNSRSQLFSPLNM